MPLQSCWIKDAFKKPGAGRCESRGGVGRLRWGGGWRRAGGRGGRACVFSVERAGLIHGDCFKMGSRKVPSSEKASEDTSEWLWASSGGNLCLRLFSKEVALVTSSEIPRQVLSILRVPLRTHQEDDSQVKSALPVRDFTQISSSPLKWEHSALPKSVCFSKAFFPKLYLWIPSTQDPQIFTGQDYNMKLPHSPSFQTEPQTTFRTLTSSLG